MKNRSIQRIYNIKFYVKKQLRNVDRELRDISAGVKSGVRSASLLEIKDLAKRVYNIGTKIEATTLDAVKLGAGQRTIEDLRDLANICEYYSLQLYDSACKLWYTDTIPHFLIFKTVLDPASDLSEQAESVRDMNLVLEGKDETT